MSCNAHSDALIDSFIKSNDSQTFAGYNPETALEALSDVQKLRPFNLSEDDLMDFIKWLIYARGLKMSTVTAYMNKLRSFCRSWLKGP